MVLLKIDGMTCGHCVMGVKTALAGVPGVTGQVEVDLKTGQARVEGAADPEALMAAVRDEGFGATLAG